MNWEIKLKTNNDYTKWLRKKIKNQKNKDKVKKIIHGKLGSNDEIIKKL